MSGTGQLAGCRILLVEDDFLVGQVVLEFLEDEGAEVLGPVGSVDEALALIAEPAATIDRALLDLNLHGTKSYPIAEVLAQRNIPFVFMTGYGRDAVDKAYRDYPHCVKPITRAALLAVLSPS